MAYVSLHGRQLILDNEKNGFVFPRLSRGLVKQTKITSAQLLALNATPQTIVPAAPTGYVNILRQLHLYKPAGTAYAGIAATEDLLARYTNGSGAQASALIEATGFLDQTTAQRRYAFGPAQTGTTTAADVTPVSAAAIVLHMNVGEITTGDSDLYVWAEYDIYPFALDVLGFSA